MTTRFFTIPFLLLVKSCHAKLPLVKIEAWVMDLMEAWVVDLMEAWVTDLFISRQVKLPTMPLENVNGMLLNDKKVIVGHPKPRKKMDPTWIEDTSLEK